MKILYLSDNYGKHNRGTKHSIYHEAQRRGHDIKFQTVHTAGSGKIDGPKLLAEIRAAGFEWVWVAHSWVEFVGCTLEDIHNAGARVLGFGFSDPYGWNPAKLDQYDAYATNHFETFDTLKAEGRLPATTIITAGDFSFHRNLRLDRDIDVLIYGAGQHIRFRPRDYRIQVVQELKNRLPHYRFRVHGTRWDPVPTEGVLQSNGFLHTINRSRVSLDLQQPHAPLAHRMFECMMCGTPTITRSRPEIQRLFGDWPGILRYETLDDLAQSVTTLLEGLDWDNLSREVQDVSVHQHDITTRMDGFLDWVKNL